MEYATVDLSRFVRSGAGANGESYDSLDDPNLMLKLYNAEYPVQPLIDELEIARKVYSIGVPSPEPGHIVRVGDRLGIIFRRVDGKRSYSRALADEPERVDEFAVEFARVCRKLHSTECPEGMFPSEKSQFLKLLEADVTFTAAEQAKLRKIIMDMPDSMTAVHGDLHMGNVLTTLPKGRPLSDPHDIYFIDLGYFAYGCPLLDVAMLYNVCVFADEDFRKAEMHVDGELSGKFWNAFAGEYFFGEDRLAEKWFGEGVTMEDVNEHMMRYVSVKLLLVEFNIGSMPENYVPMVRETLARL